MDLILNRSGLKQYPDLWVHDSTDVGVEFVPDFLTLPRLPIFRRENQMHQYL